MRLSAFQGAQENLDPLTQSAFISLHLCGEELGAQSRFESLGRIAQADGAGCRTQ
jgi:hypothetical protein